MCRPVDRVPKRRWRTSVSAGFLFFLLFLSEPVGASSQADRDVLEQLRALGYVGGVFQDREPPTELVRGIFRPRIQPASHVIEALSLRHPVTNLLTELVEDSSPTLMTISGDTRLGLRLRPGDHLSWRFRPREGDMLLLGIGREYEQVPPNQVFAQWDFIDDPAGTPLAQRLTYPVPGSWVDQHLSLDPWVGQTVLLNLTVKTMDPAQSHADVWLAPFLLACTAMEDDRPNVVFLLIDTLRADALSCYGYEDRTSPFIDVLANQGVLFDNVIAQSPHTETSIPSLLMGVYPHEHGRMFRESRRNADHPTYVGSPNLPENLRTMGEYFQSEGYYTAGVYNNVVLSERFGFQRGLYRYIDYAEAAGMTDPWGRIAVATAGLGIDHTIRILENIPEGIPFHLWVHILDPHNPYTPPDDWSGRICRSEETIDHDAYLCETMFVDAQVGRLCRALRAGGRWGNTLLIISSDHGEEFRNKLGRPKGHGRTLFQTLLQVPLIFVWPEGLESGRRVLRMVETVDIFPTVLELAGISMDEDISGQSLAGLLRGRRNSYTKNRAYAEGIRRGEERKAILGEGFKLVYFTDSGQEYLYNLRQDPAEQTNVAAEHPETLDRLRKELSGRFSLPPRPKTTEVAVLGQDGKDIVHSFLDEATYQPGLEDMHIRILEVSTPVTVVKIWADDHLQGNRAHRLGWRGPPQGERPAALQAGPGGLDIYFDPDEELAGRRVFVRVDQRDGTAWIGQFKCPPVSIKPKQQIETNDRVLVHWTFDSADDLRGWSIGSGGRVRLQRNVPGMGSGGAMRIETTAPSGRFRMLRRIGNLSNNARILIDFELAIASGGLRLEVVDPRRNALLARRDFAIEGESAGQAARLAAGDPKLVGLFFRTSREKEVLIILSNRTQRQAPTLLFLDNLRVLKSQSPE